MVSLPQLEQPGMPQIQLPIFSAGSSLITQALSFKLRHETVFYFNGHLPVFSHPKADLASFRFFTSVRGGDETRTHL